MQFTTKRITSFLRVAPTIFSAAMNYETIRGAPSSLYIKRATLIEQKGNNGRPAREGNIDLTPNNNKNTDCTTTIIID